MHSYKQDLNYIAKASIVSSTAVMAPILSELLDDPDIQRFIRVVLNAIILDFIMCLLLFCLAGSIMVGKNFLEKHHVVEWMELKTSRALEQANPLNSPITKFIKNNITEIPGNIQSYWTIVNAKDFFQIFQRQAKPGEGRSHVEYEFSACNLVFQGVPAD